MKKRTHRTAMNDLATIAFMSPWIAHRRLASLSAMDPFGLDHAAAWNRLVAEKCLVASQSCFDAGLAWARAPFLAPADAAMAMATAALRPIARRVAANTRSGRKSRRRR